MSKSRTGQHDPTLIDLLRNISILDYVFDINNHKFDKYNLFVQVLSRNLLQSFASISKDGVGMLFRYF